MWDVLQIPDNCWPILAVASFIQSFWLTLLTMLSRHFLLSYVQGSLVEIFFKSLRVRCWDSFPLHCPFGFLTAKVGSLESSDPSIPDIFDKRCQIPKKDLQLVTGGYKQNPRMLHVKCGTGKNKQIYKIEEKKNHHSNKNSSKPTQVSRTSPLCQLDWELHLDSEGQARADIDQC